MSSKDKAPEFPKTLQQAIEFFADKTRAFEFAVELRWPDGVFCPFCGSGEYSFLSTRQLWKCKGCKKQYSVRIGTIFEDSPLPLKHWFVAIWMLANCKNGVSSYELHRAIGVTQKTAWFMLHRVRAAIKAKAFDRKLAGIVEADETFIGGLMENMHAKRAQKLRDEYGRKKGNSGPGINKVIVQALVERAGEARTQILDNFIDGPRMAFLTQNIEDGSHVMTDTAYGKMGPRWIHDFINHAHEYVRGQVHTNSVENFWSCLQRTLGGTYVSVEPYHLSAYLDEQTFRFNNRKTDDGNRFVRALAMTKGCRLTYAHLTRKAPSAN